MTHYPRKRGSGPSLRRHPRHSPGKDAWVSEEAPDATSVELSVAPDLSQLFTLRALAETVGMQAGLHTGEIVDLGLAIDEAATSIITDAAPGSGVHCAFTYDPKQVFVRVAGLARSEAVLGPGHFGWHILESLAGWVDAVQGPFDGNRGGYPTVIEFSHDRLPRLQLVESRPARNRS